MKFRYVGEEYTEWFGFKWLHGTEHDVEDAHAIGKLSNSVLFQKVETAETVEAPRRGRPRKAADSEAVTDGDDQN